jgi:hypothetical protein
MVLTPSPRGEGYNVELIYRNIRYVFYYNLGLAISPNRTRASSVAFSATFPDREGYIEELIYLEIVGITYNFNFALASDLSDLSTSLRFAQDDGVLNFTAYIAELPIPKVEPHPSWLRQSTLSDREGFWSSLYRTPLNLIRQDLGGPDTFPQWGRLQCGRIYATPITKIHTMTGMAICIINAIMLTAQKYQCLVL